MMLDERVALIQGIDDRVIRARGLYRDAIIATGDPYSRDALSAKAFLLSELSEQDAIDQKIVEGRL